MEIRAIGSTPAGVRPAVEGGILPQSTQNAPSQQVTVQTAKAVPRAPEMESMGMMRRSADIRGGAEQTVNADVLERMTGGQSRMDMQRRVDSQARAREREDTSRARLSELSRQEEAAPLNEAARQAERERLQQAVNQIAEHVGQQPGGIRFAVDEELGRVIVKIVDPETDEVIKQIPSEEAVSLAKSLGRMTGMLVKTKA